MNPNSDCAHDLHDGCSCSTPDGIGMHGFPDNPLNHNELPLHVWKKRENNNNSTTDPVMDRSSASAQCRQQFMPCLQLDRKGEKSEMARTPSQSMSNTIPRVFTPRHYVNEDFWGGWPSWTSTVWRFWLIASRLKQICHHYIVERGWSSEVMIEKADGVCQLLQRERLSIKHSSFRTSSRAVVLSLGHFTSHTEQLTAPVNNIPGITPYIYGKLYYLWYGISFDRRSEIRV